MQTELEQLRRDNEMLRSRLAQMTACRMEETVDREREDNTGHVPTATQCQWQAGSHDLSSAQIARFSRQLLLPSFGIEGWALPRVVPRRLHALSVVHYKQVF